MGGITRSVLSGEMANIPIISADKRMETTKKKLHFVPERRNGRRSDPARWTSGKLSGLSVPHAVQKAHGQIWVRSDGRFEAFSSPPVESCLIPLESAKIVL